MHRGSSHLQMPNCRLLRARSHRHVGECAHTCLHQIAEGRDRWAARRAPTSTGISVCAAARTHLDQLADGGTTAGPRGGRRARADWHPAGRSPRGRRRIATMVVAPRRPPHLTAAHGRPARFCRVGEALMDLLIGSDGRGGGAPPRARLSTLCRCAAARCGLVRAWCGARRWPNTPRRRSAALEQLGLRRKRRQYRPTTYEGRWHRGFGARRAPGAQKRPKTLKTAPPANSGGLRPADRPLKLIRSAR